MIELIVEHIESAFQNGKEVTPIVVTDFGCYRPLYQYQWAHKLLKINWPVLMHEIIGYQIPGPLLEQTYSVNIPRLTMITNHISLAVWTQ